MLHLFQQTSRYNKSVIQTRYKRSTKLIRIRKLEPKPGTHNTDINNRHELSEMLSVEANETKSDTRNTNHLLYNPCQFFFLLTTLFCLLLSIQENHRTLKSLGNAKYLITRLFSTYLFYVSSFGKRADHLNCYKH